MFNKKPSSWLVLMTLLVSPIFACANGAVLDRSVTKQPQPVDAGEVTQPSDVPSCGAQPSEADSGLTTEPATPVEQQPSGSDTTTTPTAPVEGSTPAVIPPVKGTDGDNGGVAVPPATNPNTSPTGPDAVAALPLVDAPEQPDSNDASLVWTSLANTELMAKTGPSIDDIQQGLTTSCAFDAAVASMAENDPNDIISKVKAIGVTKDKSIVYSISLYDYQGKPFQVVIDDKLLSKGDGTPNDPPAYDPANGKRVLWASLFRKAWAVYQGGYANLTQGSGVTILTLTGKFVDGFGVENVSYMPAALTGAAAEQRIATASTFADINWTKSVYSSAYQFGIYLCVPYLQKNYCVVDLHDYTVMSASAQEVEVRNPWGNESPAGYTAGEGQNGRVTLPLRVYSLLFSFTSIEGTDYTYQAKGT